MVSLRRSRTLTKTEFLVGAEGEASISLSRGRREARTQAQYFQKRRIEHKSDALTNTAHSTFSTEKSQSTEHSSITQSKANTGSIRRLVTIHPIPSLVLQIECLFPAQILGPVHLHALVRKKKTKISVSHVLTKLGLKAEVPKEVKIRPSDSVAGRPSTSL